jgi:polyisoprenoid-binding protein YceI
VTAQSTSSRPSAPPSRKKRRLRIVAAVLVLFVAAGAALVWWFLRDDAPDEVSLADAAAQVTESTPATSGAVATTAPATTPATTPAGASGDVSGAWTVDTSIGEFNYEDSTGTFVGFRVEEELQGLGSVTAVGRTPTVSGTLAIDGTTVTAVSIEADMSAITTNDSRRDDKVWSALETDTFPTATFVLTQPIDLGDAATNGEAVTVDAAGELTIHGVTLPVTFPLQAQLVGDTIVVVGQVDVVFADYGVELPTAPIVLSLDDNGIIELQLFFTR